MLKIASLLEIESYIQVAFVTDIKQSYFQGQFKNVNTDRTSSLRASSQKIKISRIGPCDTMNEKNIYLEVSKTEEHKVFKIKKKTYQKGYAKVFVTP